jgi:Ni,Fe-hydrogenase III component G
MIKKTNKFQEPKSANNAALTGILLAVFMVLSAANAAAQDAPDSPVKFTVQVTYMTQGGAKKTDSIAVLAPSPSEAEREAEAQFKAKNPRSTFIRAAAEFAQAAQVGITVVVNTPSPRLDTVIPVKFTVQVTYMTQGGAKKTDSIAVLAPSPSEAEREAEAQFKAKNPRSTFIRATAE